jgi:hypothetical protein
MQPQRVIYLPPGVVPAPAPQPGAPGANVPFDRAFFEQVLPSAVESFCKQVSCEVPVVEVLTMDGTTHYVNGISGVSDSWVALHTSHRDHPHPVQAFVAYQTIFRVEIHPNSDQREHRLGFIPATGEDPEEHGPTGWKRGPH